MSQGQTKNSGLADGVTHHSPRALQKTKQPALLQFPLCVSILIGDGVCARAAMHTRARAAPG